MTDFIGKSFGRYHILEQLGEGGMATVFKAYDTRLETDVAVKVIRTDNLPQNAIERSLKRFEREAKTLARLTHTNIVSVTDYGEYDGSPYLVMKYLPGGTLKQKMGKPIHWQEAVQLLLPIAEALDYAHSQNMIHRDVKPANILLTQYGQPMLTDFGIAKVLDLEETLELTGTSAAMGTPEYMAPEQATAKTADHRADIYALGVVLYEMVTGRKPYTADTPMAVLIMHARDPLPSPKKYVPDLPDDVERVLLKALAKSPEDRYQDMKEMVSGFKRLLDSGKPSSEKVKLVRQRKISQPKLNFKLNKNVVGIIILSLLVLGLVLVGSPLREYWLSPVPVATGLETTTSALVTQQVVPSETREPINFDKNLTNNVTNTFTVTPIPFVPDSIKALFTSNVTPNPDTVFSPLQFTLNCSNLSEFSAAVVFQNPITYLCAVFTYDRMSPGAQWTALWYRDGELVYYETIPWSDETGGYGSAAWHAPTENWLPGKYEVQIFVGLDMKTIGQFTLLDGIPTNIATSTFSPLPAEIVDAKGAAMVLIPAGEFTMGSDNGMTDHRPVHTVYLDTFYIDKYEVTNAQYKVCVDNGFCQPPKETGSYDRKSYYGDLKFDDYPVIYIDWNMSKAFCEWRGAQLPTEAQWEKAARGTDGRTYPWGEGIDQYLANYDRNLRDTTKVGIYENGKSIYGAYDMAGNAMEWVADWYSETYYQNSPLSNPVGPESGQYRVLRGGSWAALNDLLYTFSRRAGDPTETDIFGIGIRCAINVVPE